MKILKLICFTSIVLIINCSSINAQWNQLGSDIDGSSKQDALGWALSLSYDGNRLAVGAVQNSGLSELPGYTQVFEWGGSGWIQLGMNIDGIEQEEQFGYSVSLSSDGNRLAIGAPFNDENGENAGQARIFEWNGTTWMQLGASISGENEDNSFGISVSLSSNGNRLAIGAPSNDGNGNDAGHVRIFDWNGAAWAQLGADVDGTNTGDNSGISVSLSSSGNRVAIGAPSNDGNGDLSGQVTIHEWDGNDWEQLGQDIYGEGEVNFSGESVSLSGDGKRLAIGATGNGGNGNDAGHTRVFEWSGTAWVQLGQDIDGEAAFDRSGISVSLSHNGNRLVIGAPENDGSFFAAGHARVYEWDGSTWVQLGQDIDGEAIINQSGLATFISPNGNRIAIGAPYNSDNSMNAGHTRIFEGFIVSLEGLELNENKLKIDLFPNPTTDKAHLIVRDLEKISNVNVEIWEINGRMLLSKSATMNNDLSFNNYPKGVYEVLLRNMLTGKIIITKMLVVK